MLLNPVSRCRQLCAATILFCILLFGSGLLSQAAFAQYAIQNSQSPTRSDALALQNQALAGNLYIFVTPTSGITKVEFFLDNPSASGTPRQTESLAPYDFAGTNSTTTSLANPFNSTAVADGPHTVTARITPTSGSPQLVSASFTVANKSTGNQPGVGGTNPINGATNIRQDQAVSADLLLPNSAGVDQATLSTSTVRLLRAKDNQAVPGTVNTSGGADAIVLQPTTLLDASTQYIFEVTSGLHDESGAAFVPYSGSFTTGTTTSPRTPGTSFIKQIAYSGAALASLVIGPDGKLYATSIDGNLRRWTIGGDGTLSNLETYTGLAGRSLLGLAFDPRNSKVLWLANDAPIYIQPAPDFSGKITKLILNSSSFSGTLQDYIVGLPRSTKDHATNSLAFGPDGKLYLTQGSNSAMGAPDETWGNREEHLLNAAVLQVSPKQIFGLPINVQTDPYGSFSGPFYDPFAKNAPVKIYAAGVRNAYDLVWHSNGNLYLPTNGSAAGGNTPSSPAGVSPAVPAITGGPTQNDYLFKVVPAQSGGYFGHPNPTRGQYVMNGGNPTSGVDPAEVVTSGVYLGYPVGVLPDVNYRGFAYNFGLNRSPDGAIEYKSSSFAGVLKNQLLVVEYSAGDDILTLTPGSDGNIATVTQLSSGFTDPVDLTEDGRNGNLYVAELIDGGQSGGRIVLLRVNPNPPTSGPSIVVTPGSLNFGTVSTGAASPSQTLILNNTSIVNLTVSSLAIAGADADQFQMTSLPTLPLTIAPGGSARVNLAFKPTSAGAKSAMLQVTSNAPLYEMNLTGSTP